jgi:hypothetical protein
VRREALKNFQVDSAVVHFVPTERDDPGADLLLTDEEIDLSDGLRDYFKDKIIERLESKGLDVIRDAEEASCVPDEVAAISGNKAGLVDASKAIALQLDAVQKTKVNSSGLLAVVRGSVDDSPCLALLKLERERGVRFAISTVDGRYIVDLELLRNLTLTDKTKVYKTAVLSGPDPSSITGFVADDQRGLRAGRLVGQFFLSEFLGCKPRLPAAELTYKFVEAANSGFNANVESPERRGRYSVAMLAEIQSQSTSSNPTDFAKQHLEQADREPFLESIRNAGVDPSGPFPKDTELLHKASKFKMTFESGMVLVGSGEDLDRRVDLPASATSNEPVVLRDNVRALLTGR